MNNDVVFEYYFDDEQKDLKKAVQIANGIYNNKIGVETNLVPSMYVLDEKETFVRYLKIRGTLILH